MSEPRIVVVTARPVILERGEVERSNDQLAALRRFAGAGIDPETVHIRGAHICNSARDFYYSRFDRSKGALQEVAELVPGRPLALGHRMDGETLARFFMAQEALAPEPRKAPRKDRYWTDGLFYFPKDDEGDRLARRIDIGVIREVSLHWGCVGANCSLDGLPYWQCPHMAGEIYDDGFCEILWSGITTVLEVSLVVAGGQKGTSTFQVQESRHLKRGESVRAVTVDEMRDEKVARMRQTQRDSIFDDPTPERAQPLRGSVQALVCAKSRFSEELDAAQWVREQDFDAHDRSEESGAWIFRQFSTSSCERNSAREIALDEGVTARVCSLKPAPQQAEAPSDSIFA